IQLAPARPDGYVALAILQNKEQKFPDAEASFQKALSVNPNFLPARLLLGDFYQQQKRWPEAEQQYQAAIAAAPDNPGPRIALARFYVAQGRQGDAESSLAQAKS